MTIPVDINIHLDVPFEVETTTDNELEYSVIRIRAAGKLTNGPLSNIKIFFRPSLVRVEALGQLLQELSP